MADPDPEPGPRPSLLRRVAVALLIVGAVGSVAFAALRLVQPGGLPWPGPPTMAFTPYAIPVVAVLAVLGAILRRRVETVALVAACLVLAAIVLPRAVARDGSVVGGEGRPLRVLTVNALLGRADPEALASLVRRRRPDVLAIEESSPVLRSGLRRAGLEALLPYRAIRFDVPGNDTVVMARWPVRQVPGRLPPAHLRVVVDAPDGPPVPVLVVHPRPPIGPALQRQWRAALASVPGPTGAMAGGIVAGDFNATLDHAELQRILGAGWRDAGRERGAGLEPTWRGRALTRLTIDHVLVPPGATVEGYAVDDVVGSDHRAVTAALRLPDAAALPR